MTMANQTEAVAAVQCGFEAETEYYGEHLSKLMVNDPGQCCSACQQDPKCHVLTYKLPSSPKHARTCWLLIDATVVDRVSEASRMVSGIREPEKKPIIKYEDNVHYGDRNLYILRTSTVEECAQLCAKKLLCKAVSYSKPVGRNSSDCKAECDNHPSTTSRNAHFGCLVFRETKQISQHDLHQ